MESEFRIAKKNTLTPEQQELKERINDRMRNVTPEEYDTFVLERGRDKKAEILAGDLASFLDEEKRYKALELGSGTGIFTNELNKIENVDLTCLDIRKDLLEYGIEKGRIRKDQTVVGDFEMMGFDSQTFDLLTGMAIVNQRRDREKFFSELKRVLKDDALIFLPWIKRKGDSYERETKILEENGFEIISTEGSYILAKKLPY